MTHSSKTEFITSRSEYSTESIEQFSTGRLYVYLPEYSTESIEQFSTGRLHIYIFQNILQNL